MPFKKGCKKAEGSGLKKGQQLKSTVVAKEAFQLAFDGIGGHKALARWASLNQTDFYKIYGRLIPIDTNIGGQKDNPVLFDSVSDKEIIERFNKQKPKP